MRRFFARFVNLFRGREAEREMAREIESHLALLQEDFERRGLPPAEAALAARRAYGGVEQSEELHREARSFAWIEQLAKDVCYGWSNLLRNPGFTLVALISLALGIGVVTAIFSIFDAVWLRPMPYPHADRLVAVSEVELAQPAETWDVAMANYFDWKAQSKSFEQLTLIRFSGQILIGGGQPEQVTGQVVSPGFFEICGGKALHGRLFLPEEYEEGAQPVVVLGHGLWQRLFGSDPGVLGRQINLEFSAHTIVGVLTPDFASVFPGADLWTPSTGRMTNRRARYFQVIGRLRPGISVGKAQAEMDLIARRLAEQYPAQKGFGARVEPLRDYMYGDWKRRFLVFFGAVVLVLLIACMNVADLILARAAAREKEMAVRASLGAGQRRLIRQLLTENFLIVGLGAALAVLIAFLAVRLLIGIDPDAVPRSAEIGINLHVLGFAILTAVVSGLLFGLAPALSASKPDLNESLKETGRRTTTHLGSRRAHSALVVMEIALSLTLLAGAGLMIEDTWRLLHLNPGFDSRSLVTMRVALPVLQYTVDGGKRLTLKPQAALVRQQIHERLQALPGVQSVSVAILSPLEGCLDRYVSTGSNPPPSSVGVNTPWVCLHPVTPEYFRTLQVPVLRGRQFTDQDNQSTPPVAVINESLVRRYFPGEDPIGKVLNLALEQGGKEPSVQIVGIVPDIRQSLLRPQVPAIYEPYSQWPVSFGGTQTFEHTYITFLVRAATNPSSIEPAMRRVVSEVARDVPVTDLQTIDDIRSLRLQRSRLYAWLLAVFAGIAVTLAAVGVFGVMSYTVAQRTREIGLRVALGAQPWDVLKLVMRRGLLVTSAGVAIGLAASFGVTRFLASLLHEVKPTDPLVFAAVPLLLSVVALLACFIPVRRALGMSPTKALRHE